MRLLVRSPRQHSQSLRIGLLVWLTALTDWYDTLKTQRRSGDRLAWLNHVAHAFLRAASTFVSMCGSLRHPRETRQVSAATPAAESASVESRMATDGSNICQAELQRNP
jgi:hypothetical protein